MSVLLYFSPVHPKFQMQGQMQSRDWSSYKPNHNYGPPFHSQIKYSAWMLFAIKFGSCHLSCVRESTFYKAKSWLTKEAFVQSHMIAKTFKVCLECK